MIEHKEGRYCLSGPVTIHTVCAVRAQGLAAFAREGAASTPVDIDLAAVTDIDSSALSLLFEWARVLAHQGRHARFHNITQNMRTLASVYEVLELLPIE